MNSLDIIYCMNCKYCQEEPKMGFGNISHACELNNYNFNYKEPELYCHKKCFKKKPILNKKGK